MITFAPHSPRDQTREQELILPKANKGQQLRHDSLYSPKSPLHLLRTTPAHNNAPTATPDDGDDVDKEGRTHGGHRNSNEEYDDDEEGEDDDDSEYDEDSMDDEDESELDDSDIDDDDYSDSGSEHTKTGSSTQMSLARNDPHRIAPISSETNLFHPTANHTNNSNTVPLTTTPDHPSPNGVHPISAQRAQQEVVKQLTLAAGAWKINPDKHSSTESNSSGNSNNDRSTSSVNATTHVRDNGMDERVLMLETVRPRDGGPLSSTTRRPPSHDHASALPPLPSTDTPTMWTSHQQQQQQQQCQQRIPDQGTTSSRSSASGTLSSPGDALQVAKTRMLPYVEDDAEDEDDYSGEDEDEEEDEDEDDYSYSEDEDEEEEEDDEDEDSSSEYHYGVKKDPANRTNKPRTPPPGQYTRSIYSHHRPPRLDENYLRKRAITKQVVRRSSLTALLGEASQPATPPLTLQAKNFTIHPTGSPLGQNFHQSAQGARRPGLTGVWSEAGLFPESPLAQHQDERTGLKPHSSNSENGRIASTVSGLRPGSNLSEQNRRLMLGPNAATAVLSQEPNRPRRTDSGVEVKISPHQHRSSGSGGSDSRSSNEPQPTRWADISVMESSSSVHSTNGQGSSQIPTITIIPARRPRMKSEGDAPDARMSSSVGVSSDGMARNSPDGSTDVSQIVKQPLKSSISCHTFPRTAGKRVGRKHVSWHHSLFPTERVLRVKPSLPSLSNVAVESAKATLSQLPNIPVMARDNVKDFHQSIRSLRTLSRDEITKMSYKQQGRQELTSAVPISKSANDSTSWWSLSRWLKGPPTVDKRHWKVTTHVFTLLCNAEGRLHPWDSCS